MDSLDSDGDFIRGYFDISLKTEEHPSHEVFKHLLK